MIHLSRWNMRAHTDHINRAAPCVPVKKQSEFWRSSVSDNITHVTDASFDQEVLRATGPVLVDYWAEWCGPCRAIGPVIEELSKDYDGKINVGKLNVDNNPQVSMNYGITSIPAILFIKGGQVVDKLVGAQPKANFVKKIEAHI